MPYIILNFVKKAFSILFLGLYVFLSVGMNVMVHACSSGMETHIASSSEEGTCVCNDETSQQNQPSITADGSCCSTELKQVKIDDAQTVTPIKIQQNLTIIGILPSTKISDFGFQHSIFDILQDTSPPSKIDLHISNSVFLI